MIIGSKIEKIYFATKALAIGPFIVWTYIDGNRAYQDSQFIILLAAYLVINLVMYQLTVKRWIRGTNMLFSLSFVDALFLYFSIQLDSGLNNHLYLTYYPLIAIVSLYLPVRKVVAIALVFSASYIFSTINQVGSALLPSVSLRTLYIWFTGGIAGIISYYMNSSERKLLKTLDILNERTWELESSQAVIENMYEITRALSTILDLPQLLTEVLNIADDHLQVRKCAILLPEKSGKNLQLYAELFKGKKTMYDPPIQISEKKTNEIINDRLWNSPPALRQAAHAQFQLFEVPLISHGKVMGLLQLQPLRKGNFSDKERKNLTIFANSTAVAIDNAIMHMKMQELTIIDELTGLYNYRYFRSKLIDEIRRSDRYHLQLSILMVDIDHFKALNDSQGHQSGNLILQEIAGVIRHSVRDVDIAARYGGEEFMVILPQTVMKDALTIAQRIRSQIEKTYYTNSQGQRDLRATVSVGVAVYPDGVFSAAQLLEKVDQALYMAKRQGRNRVCIDPGSKKEAKGTVAR